ncbi:MAG: hypothetical protein J6I45_02140 [Clostridia bacterium]|nr:hypothetical protein [Clostridia bacterium]
MYQLDKFDKSSYSRYLGEKLTCSEQPMMAFDREKSYICDGKTERWQIIDTPTGSFHISVTDLLRQTVKLWVYINDIDLIACDHDFVYKNPQKNSGTLWITFAGEQGGIGHTLQHTFQGSGWHEMEISFACHNVAYPNLCKIPYGDLTSLNIWCFGYEGLEVRLADMRFCTYDNPGYVKPQAPYGGRWFSTCDWDALDGVILTEWYGSCFDIEDKQQGSSSVRITGHKENVDHRVCIGIDNVPVSYEEDCFCMDMYINDPELLGCDWQIRIEHNAQAAHYSMNYAIMTAGLVDEKLNPAELKAGWNHFVIPFSSMNVRIGEAYKDVFTKDLVITLLVLFIAGTGESEEENYIIKYDNIYVAKKADIEKARKELN